MTSQQSLINTGETVATGYMSIDGKSWQLFMVAVDVEWQYVDAFTIAELIRIQSGTDFKVFLAEICIFDLKNWLLTTNDN